jgi:hypothetical protein
MTKVHWHRGYSNKTACGILAYPTKVPDEYDTAINGRIECTPLHRKVTCLKCQRVMMIGKYDRTKISTELP